MLAQSARLTGGWRSDRRAGPRPVPCGDVQTPAKSGIQGAHRNRLTSVLAACPAAAMTTAVSVSNTGVGPSGAQHAIGYLPP
jgi:hypothetical protein